MIETDSTSKYSNTIWIVLFTAEINVGILIPVLPVVSLKHGLSAWDIGSILAILPGLVSILSPVISMLLAYVPRYKVFDLGLFIEVIATGALAASFRVKDSNTFFVLLIVIRILQSFALAMVIPVGMAMMTILYPKSKQQYLAYSDLILGLGLFIGPVFGSLIIYLSAYEKGFAILAAMYFMVGVYARSNRPLKTILDDNSVISPTQGHCHQQQQQEQEEAEDDLFIISERTEPDEESRDGDVDEEEVACLIPDDTTSSIIASVSTSDERVTFWEFLLNWRIFIGAMSVTYVHVAVCYLRTLLPGYLLQNHIEASMGLWLAGFALSFAVVGLSVGSAYKDLDRRYFLFAGLLISGLLVTLTGPFYLTETWSLPENLVLLKVGVVSLGFGVGLIETTLGVELVNAGKLIYPGAGERVDDFSAGIFSAALNFGTFIGFIIAGLLGEVVEYREGSTVVGIGLLVFSILFWITNHPQKNQESQKSRFQRQKMR